MKFNRVATAFAIAMIVAIIGLPVTLQAEAPGEMDSIWLHVSEANWEKDDEGFHLNMEWELYVKKATDRRGTKFTDWAGLEEGDVDFTYRMEVAEDSAFNNIVKTEETTKLSGSIRDLDFEKFYLARVRVSNPPENYRDDFAAGQIYKHEKPVGGGNDEKKGIIGELKFTFKYGGWQIKVIFPLAAIGFFIFLPITWYKMRLANVFPPNKPGFLYSALPIDKKGKTDHMSPKGNIFIREVAKYWARAMAAMSLDAKNWGSDQAFITASRQEEEEKIKKMWIEDGLPAIEQAIDICKNGVPGIKLKKKPLEYPFPRVLLAALENQRSNRNNWWASQEMDRATENTSLKEIDGLKGWAVTGFWALGSIEPMFGLFGTVQGIQTAFMQIKAQLMENPDAQMAETVNKLAGGIQQALITTIYGLMFGIPFMLMYYYYRGKADWIFGKWEEIVIEILNRA